MRTIHLQTGPTGHIQNVERPHYLCCNVRVLKRSWNWVRFLWLLPLPFRIIPCYFCSAFNITDAKNKCRTKLHENITAGYFVYHWITGHSAEIESKNFCLLENRFSTPQPNVWQVGRFFAWCICIVTTCFIVFYIGQSIITASYILKS